MSGSGRATEFMRAWGEGHGKPHNPGCDKWGADPCDRCITESHDPWEALVFAASIAWPDDLHPVPETPEKPRKEQP